MFGATMDQRQRQNRGQTITLLLGLGILLLAVGWVFAGSTGVVWFLCLGAFLVWMGQRVGSEVLMRLYKAKELDQDSAPELSAIMTALTKRAGLKTVPRLYYVPSKEANAFTTGRGDEAVVVVFDGLLRKLDLRQVAGVLAHEISHIKNKDIVLMGAADVVSRITGIMPWMAVFLFVSGGLTGLKLPLLGLVFLFVAPQISAFLQRSLSHAREYDADQDAAELTGDPEGLAQALERIAHRQQGFLAQIFFPSRRNPHPSQLRTHPPTDERIRRLLTLREGSTAIPQAEAIPAIRLGVAPLHASKFSEVQGSARRRLGGLWY